VIELIADRITKKTKDNKYRSTTFLHKGNYVLERKIDGLGWLVLTNIHNNKELSIIRFNQGREVQGA
jgi:hypothetical protein